MKAVKRTYLQIVDENLELRNRCARGVIATFV